MSKNSTEMVYEFNEKAGLLAKGYNEAKEAAFPIEEMLEGLNDLNSLVKALQLPAHPEGREYSPKELSRIIVGLAHDSTKPSIMQPVDRADKHFDALVYNYGSLYKQGLSVDQVERGLKVVMNANMTKLSVGTDSEGKQMKPEGFVNPEDELQKILDENKGN